MKFGFRKPSLKNQSKLEQLGRQKERLNQQLTRCMAKRAWD